MDTTIRLKKEVAAKLKRRADKLGVSIGRYLEIAFEPRAAGRFMEVISMVSKTLGKGGR